MKKIILLLFLSISILSAKNINFDLNIIYLKVPSDDRDELKDYEKAFEKALNSYDWELPDGIDFDKIVSSINIRIENEHGNGKYKGMIMINSGIANNRVTPIPLHRDIIFKELEISFSMDYTNDNIDLDNSNMSSIEAIIKFYAYLILGENYDRLSFTDKKKFILSGDFYYKKIYELEGLINNNEDRTNWKERIKIISAYKLQQNILKRRLNSLIYNAIYFYNSGKSKRSVLFLNPILKHFKKLNYADRKDYFSRYYFGLGKIISAKNDDFYRDEFIKLDKKHKGIYQNRKI